MSTSRPGQAEAAAVRKTTSSPTDMTASHIAAVPAGCPRIADVASAGRKISDRVHAAAGDRARAPGWEVTETPGPLGLNGRSYRDIRFAALRQDRQDTAARKGWTP
jgi:hypothetical protein